MYNNKTMASYQSDIKTVDGLRAFILKGRNKTSRKIDNNTVARLLDNNGVAIKLHDTDIIKYDNNGTVTLNSGGWKTVTTKERLNKYTQAGVSQKAGIWYMADGSLFYDGIKLDKNNKVIKPKSPAKTASYEKKLKTIKKQAREYAKNFVKALKNGQVELPSSGDCWYCSMHTVDGKSLGQATSNSDHISDHIKEGYYVPSLLVNAGKSAGYKDFQIGLMGIGGQKVYIDPENNIYKFVVKSLQAGIEV